jgi:hypothetical protein
LPATGRSPHAILLGLIIVTGAALRLWGIGFGLPHPLCRPDEEFIISVALRLFSGDYNPHFFEWPSLHFYVVHGLMRVAYAFGHLAGTYDNVDAFTRAVTNDVTWVYWMCRLLSVTAAVATFVVVFDLVRTLFDRTTALVATAFLSFAYLHVRDSHFGVLEPLLTLLIAIVVRLLASAWRRERALAFFALAGACAGLATSLKYNAAALLVAGLVTVALRFEARRRDAQGAVASLGVFVVAFAVCFFAGTPYALLDYPAFRAGIDAQVVRLTQGHGISIDHVWLRHLTFSLNHGLGLPVLVAGLAGIVVLALTNWRQAAFLCAFPLSYYIVIGSGHTAFVRYTTPLVPFLCVTAAVTVRLLVEKSARRSTERVRGLLTAAVVIVLAWPSLATIIRFDRLLTERDTRVLAAEWLAPHISPKEGLYQSGAAYAWPHFAWRPGSIAFVPLEFDQGRNRFVTQSGDESTPDWIVMAGSPLRLYTPVPPSLRGILSADYQLVQTFAPTKTMEQESLFDRQDAFFMPYADFSARERPGPEIGIYRRVKR